MRTSSGGAFCSIAEEMRHRVAGQDVLADAGLAEDDLAGGDPVRTTSRTPQVRLELVVEVGQRALALGRRLDRAQGVVVVADRAARRPRRSRRR